MPNQYAHNFHHRIQDKFGQSAESLLTQYAKDNLTYDDAAKKTGVGIGTIRKWCRRYEIVLMSKYKRKPPIENGSLHNKPTFKSSDITPENALSRQWLTTSVIF